MFCLAHLRLIKCAHCRCSQRTLCKGPGSHTAWSCNTNRAAEVVKTLTIMCDNMILRSSVTYQFRAQWPFEGPHLEKFVHNSTLHLSKEEPCLREKLCQSTQAPSLTHTLGRQNNVNIQLERTIKSRYSSLIDKTPENYIKYNFLWTELYQGCCQGIGSHLVGVIWCFSAWSYNWYFTELDVCYDATVYDHLYYQI